MENITSESLVKVFYYTALISTTLYILKMFLFAVFGGDTEVHTDFNSSFETDDSFDFLSIQSILAFLMGTGWMGLTAIKTWGMKSIMASAIAIIFGLVIMTLSAYLMFCVKKLNKRVIKDYTKAVGIIGKAYTKFEPKGMGQIEIEINKQLSIEEAENTSDETIEAFSPIKVVKYENNKLYIEKE